MKLNIQPEDKTPPEPLTTLQHPALINRLKKWAASMDSSVDHVLGQVLEQVVPSDKPAKQRRTKSAKEAIRKVA